MAFPAFQSGGRDVNQEGKRIKELVDRIEGLPDAVARELLHECLQSLLASTARLARILQVVKMRALPVRKSTTHCSMTN